LSTIASETTETAITTKRRNEKRRWSGLTTTTTTTARSRRINGPPLLSGCCVLFLFLLGFVRELRFFEEHYRYYYLGREWARGTTAIAAEAPSSNNNTSNGTATSATTTTAAGDYNHDDYRRDHWRKENYQESKQQQQHEQQQRRPLVAAEGDLTVTPTTSTSTGSAFSQTQGDDDDRQNPQQLVLPPEPDQTQHSSQSQSQPKSQEHRGGDNLPLCARSQVLIDGRWVPAWYEQPPYISHTVHLRCHTKEHYAQFGYHTYEWKIGSSKGNGDGGAGDAGDNSNGSGGVRHSGSDVKAFGDYEDDDPSSVIADSPTSTHLLLSSSSPHTSRQQKTQPLCHFKKWNSTDFCQLVSRGVVSVIGDSLSWEQYSSLMQLLRVRVHQLDQHRSKNLDKNHVLFGCGAKFVYRNDPRLTKILDSVRADFPLLLILNRGAHYVNDTALKDQMLTTIEHIRAWRKGCDTLYLKCHLFWRTTVPGHPNCTNNVTIFTSDDSSNSTRSGLAYEDNRTRQLNSQQHLPLPAPIHNLSQVEEYVEDLNNYDNLTLTYHWYDFKHQNELMLRMLEEANLEFTVIDAYELSLRRLDGHRVREKDCLHHCYPGIMDVYNQLLLHFLSMERTQDDIESFHERLQRVTKRYGNSSRINSNAEHSDKEAEVEHRARETL